MSIASELAAFSTPSGIKCRVADIAESHPAEYKDLIEAIASPEAGTVVERWWNATRAEATGVEMSDQIIRRHRGSRVCRRCR